MRSTPRIGAAEHIEVTNYVLCTINPTNRYALSDQAQTHNMLQNDKYVSLYEQHGSR